MDQEMRFPFLVDTNITCGHINPNGEQFPPGGIRAYWAAAKPSPPDLGVSVTDNMDIVSNFGAV